MWKVKATTGSDGESKLDGQVSITVFGDNGCSDVIPLGEPGDGKYIQGEIDECEVG